MKTYMPVLVGTKLSGDIVLIDRETGDEMVVASSREDCQALGEALIEMVRVMREKQDG